MHIFWLLYPFRKGGKRGMICNCGENWVKIFGGMEIVNVHYGVYTAGLWTRDSNPGSNGQKKPEPSPL